MMIRTAGGPSVSPIDFNERKTPLFTRNTWIALGVVATAHIAIGSALIYQRFELGEARVQSPTPPITTVTLERPVIPEEPKVQPQPEKPVPPTTRTNPLPAPPQTSEVITIASGDTVAASTTLTTTTTVDVPVVDATPTPPQPQPPAVIRNPSWISQPNGDQLMRAYPSRAATANIEGSASLNCLVQTDGRVGDCRITGETPGNYGFGRAAQNLSRYFRINPRTVDGSAQGSRVNINLRFNLPE